MNLPKFAIKNQPIVLASAFLAIAYGVYTWNTAPRKEDPSFNVRDAWIITFWPGATAEEMERQVADPIELQMAGIMTTRKLDTVCYPGMCVMQLTTVDAVSDTAAVWDKVRRELKLVELKLPPGVIPPILNDHASAATTMMLCMYQDPESAKQNAYEPREMQEYAERLRDRIMDLRPVVPGSGDNPAVPIPSMASFVERVDLWGVQEEVVFVETDLGNWSQLGLNSTQLGLLLQARNVVVPGGTIETANARFNVQASGSFNTVQQIQGITAGRVATQPGGAKLRQPLAIATQMAISQESTGGDDLPLPLTVPLTQNVPVKLGDLDVKVKRGYRDPVSAITRYSDAETSYPCLCITFTMKNGVNIVDLEKELNHLLETANQTVLPPDLNLVKVSDQPVTVNKKVAEVSANVISSIAVVVVVLVFMAGLRTALIAALAIPAIMLITIGVMRYWGIDIEQVSLAALIVALGILVDNTIQVSDNTQKFMDKGSSPTDAAIEGPNQIGFSILIATGTILAAFLPMVFCLTGGMQEYARSLPLVVSISLALGWVFAMTVTAIMAKSMLRPGGDINPLIWLKAKFSRKPKEETAEPESGDGPYAKLCLVAIKARWLTLAGAYVFLVAAVSLLVTGKVPGDFFPKSDRNQFVCDLFLPAGTPIQKTNEVQLQLEKLIRALNHKGYVDGKLVDLPNGETRLKNMASLVGTGGPYNFAGLFPKDGGSHYGIVWITTGSGEQVPQFVEDIRRAAAEGIGQPGDADFVAPIMGARVVPHQLISGVPVKTPIDIRVLGPRDANEQILRKFGRRVADVLRESGLAWDVSTSWGEFTRQLDVEVDQDKANLAGVTNASVLMSLNAYYSGHPLISYREGDKQIPVMLRLPPEQRETLDDLDAVYVEGLTGKVPLNSIANIKRTWTNGKIHRNQRQRCLSIGAEPEVGLLFSQVLEKVQPKIDEIAKDLPPGYRIEQGGTKEEADKGLRMNLGALGIGAVLIYFLLVIQFNSIVKPMMIALTLPLSAGGGLLGLYVMGVTMGFMETVGFLALFGIVLSAAILLIDFSETLVKDKLAKGEGLAKEGEKSYCGLTQSAFYDCLAQAGQLRLMPILMTTLTTVGGLLSLMFGGPLFKGMATVIVVGLSIGTLFTLFVQPAVYAIFVDFGMKLGGDEPQTSEPAA